MRTPMAIEVMKDFDALVFGCAEQSGCACNMEMPNVDVVGGDQKAGLLRMMGRSGGIDGESKLKRRAEGKIWTDRPAPARS